MNINKDDIGYWANKICNRAKKCYLFNGKPNISVAQSATCLFDILVMAEKNTIESASLKDIHSVYGISPKYFHRAVAAIARCGRIREASLMAPSIKIVAHLDDIHKHKASVRLKRRESISRALRSMILEADGYQCAHCKKVFESNTLAVDHIIPASLLGADEPGNWVTLCSSCNGTKSDQFRGDYLTLYRGKPIKGNVGMRFSGGCFWPYINGKIRKDTRQDWAKK